ncbi:MAG: hypothetical protein PHQ75_14375, partial [Thermoguttaceae bacterium]|nr:hypothetical protein [Thermoguttaceae bacterium]
MTKTRTSTRVLFAAVMLLITSLAQTPDVSAADSNEFKQKDRELWNSLIQGENLALGRPVQLVPAPDYRLTIAGNTDELDLTDGKLTTQKDDKLWFDAKAVGWYMAPGQDRYLKIDLGVSQPVGRLVIRCLGGTTHNFKFPRQFDTYVSKDGENYYPTHTMQKLMPCEAHQSDFKRFYYVDEPGSMYDTRVYPFVLDINADARFVLLKITGATASVFSDEWAIMKAEKKTADFNSAYTKTPRRYPFAGLAIQTCWPEFCLIRNVVAPQHFMVTDLRVLNDRKEKSSLVIELPDGIVPLPNEIVGQKEESTTVPPGYTRYVWELTTKGGKTTTPVLYFTLKDAQVKQIAHPVVVYARCGSTDQFKTSLPVRLVQLDEIKPFEKLHVGLAWMSEKEQMLWPDFFANWKKLGFNAVACFPRYWKKDDDTIPEIEYVNSARKAGFKVVMNTSPFHMMTRGYKPGDEIYCQLPTHDCKDLCPSYHGEAYAGEMRRVAELVRRSCPDYVFYDIECWHQALNNYRKCSRCQKAIADSGKSAEEYFFDCGTQTTADLKAAVTSGAKQAKIAMPIIGSYNRQMARAHYAIEDFPRTYPKYVDMSMPSLYVGGRALDVHYNISDNHRLQGDNRIIPWLSAGTYGEFDPRNMEYMILEAILNGVEGITYYCFGDFDTPLDFYYHAKALAEVRPYETVVAEGKPVKLVSSNNDITCSAMQNGKELLVLLGNYLRA